MPEGRRDDMDKRQEADRVDRYVAKARRHWLVGPVIFAGAAFVAIGGAAAAIGDMGDLVERWQVWFEGAAACRDVYIQSFQSIVPKDKADGPFLLDFDGQVIALPKTAVREHSVITLRNYDAGDYDVRVFMPASTRTVEQLVTKTRTEARVFQYPEASFAGIVMKETRIDVPVIDQTTVKVELAVPEVVIAKSRVQLTNHRSFLLRFRSESEVSMQPAELAIERLRSESPLLAQLPSCNNASSAGESQE